MKNESSAHGRRSRSAQFLCLVLATLLAAAGCSGIRRDAPPPGVPFVSTQAVDDTRTGLAGKGRSQFLHCNACHAIEAAASAPTGDSVGPHLESIVGRVAASVEGFAYTEELKALELVWDEVTLDEWLQAPQAIVPDMCAPFTGIANPAHREALIAYLKRPTR